MSPPTTTSGGMTAGLPSCISPLPNEQVLCGTTKIVRIIASKMYIAPSARSERGSFFDVVHSIGRATSGFGMNSSEQPVVASGRQTASTSAIDLMRVAPDTPDTVHNREIGRAHV